MRGGVEGKGRFKLPSVISVLMVELIRNLAYRYHLVKFIEID